MLDVWYGGQDRKSEEQNLVTLNSKLIILGAAGLEPPVGICMHVTNTG